jgi:hypothetical protein
VPIFLLPLADQSASATCSVDTHETPAVSSTSLAAKIQARTDFRNAPTATISYPYTQAWPALRTDILANVVPTSTNQQ